MAFLILYLDVLSVWKIIRHYLFRLFFCPIHSLLLLLDSSYTDVRPYHCVTYVSMLVYSRLIKKTPQKNLSLGVPLKYIWQDNLLT